MYMTFTNTVNKHCRNDSGSENVSKLILIVIAFIVGSLLLVTFRTAVDASPASWLTNSIMSIFSPNTGSNVDDSGSEDPNDPNDFGNNGGMTNPSANNTGTTRPSIEETTEDSGAEQGTVKPSKLVAKSGSTAVLDRGGQSAGDYTADSEWYIYGLEKFLTDTVLLDKYIDIEGDGHIEIKYIYFDDNNNQCYSNNRDDAFFKTSTGIVYVGTGTIVNVYNADNTLAESFKVIIFGDINGDSGIHAVDSTLVDREVAGYTNWSKPFDTNNNPNPEYNACYVMAADLDNDKTITKEDATSLSHCVSGVGSINQVTGKYE